MYIYCIIQTWVVNKHFYVFKILCTKYVWTGNFFRGTLTLTFILQQHYNYTDKIFHCNQVN